MSTNPDSRPLKPGWTEHYDPHRNLWFYINNNILPPRMSVFHPADVPTTPETPFPQSRLTQEPSLNAALTSVRRTQNMSFAQQLYANAKETPSNVQPTTQAPNGHGVPGPSYAPGGYPSHDKAELQAHSSTAVSQSIASVRSSSNRQEESDAFGASSLYNPRLQLGLSTQSHANTSSQPTHDRFRRSYTIASLPGTTPVPSHAALTRYQPDIPKPSAPPTILLNPNPTPVYQEPTGAAAPPVPQKNSDASTGPPSYPFPVLTSQSPEGRVSSPSQSSSPPGYPVSSPANQTANLGTSTFSSSPTSYAAPSAVSPPSPTNIRPSSILSWNSAPATSGQIASYPPHHAHYSATLPTDFSPSTNYVTNSSNSPGYAPAVPNDAAAVNYGLPYNTQVSNPTFAGVTTPATNYTAPATSYTTVPNGMTQTSIQPNYTVPQTTYPAAPAPSFNQPMAYASPMGVPVYANTYPQQQQTNVGTNQPTKPMTGNQASTKVLLSIAKAVGQAAISSTKDKTNNDSVLDTLANLPTGNQSGSGGGGGGGGNDAISGLVNSFSGMMGNNNDPTSGFGGSFQQPDFSSQYQNLMNQYQQLQFQQQQGQPNMSSPGAQQIMLQMQQLQQQMAQQQMQQQMAQQQMQQQQQQMQQQPYQYYQPVQQQQLQGGATKGSEVVTPSAAEIGTAIRQAAKYVKYGARVAKFATTLK